MKITNTSEGPRGIQTKAGVVMLEAGETTTVDASEGDVAAAKSAGWFKFGGADDKPEEPGPLDGSVDELSEHLKGVTDPDEVQKLINAETAGKSRKGALAALEARRDELLA